MQTETWVAIKKTYGWNSDTLKIKDTDVISYKRMIPGLGKLAYIPGLAGLNTVDIADFTHIIKDTYKRGVFAARLELNEPYNEPLLAEFKKSGWKHANSHVQYRHTIVIDLTKALDDIWMNFKSRGRYEVLQAQKAGVEIKDIELTDDNLNKMYDLMQITSTRNKFFIRDKQFTMDYWRAFGDVGKLKLFFAYHNSELLAGTVVILIGTSAWNKDGGSTRDKANLMAPRLMQWEIMKKLKREGVSTYDLGGIPSPDSYSSSTIPGIYIFKSAFSKDTHTLMPTLELPLNAKYSLWPKAEKQWLRVYNLFAHNLWW